MAEKKTTEQFISGAREVHGDRYDYSKVKYDGAHKKVIIGCVIEGHGDYTQAPTDHLCGKGCPACGDIDIANTKRLRLSGSFVKKAREIHGEKYDYSMVVYESASNTVTIICPVHGEFVQTPNAHHAGKGCQDCAKIVSADSRRSTTEEFIVKARVVHGDRYSYTKVNYTGNHDRLIITCGKHGDFIQAASDHLSGKGCRSCSESRGEAAINRALKSCGYKNIAREHRIAGCSNPKTGYMLPFDFMIKVRGKPVLIEYHGQQHYEYISRWFHRAGKHKFIEQQERDAIKSKYAMDNGIPLVVIPYTTNDVRVHLMCEIKALRKSLK